MRDEICDNCNVPLMKNKAGEMLCVSCYNYYTLKDKEPVFLRNGPVPKELGIRLRPEEKKQMPSSPPLELPKPIPIQEPPPVLLATVDTLASQRKLQLIENVILPSLESQLINLSKYRLENIVSPEG